MESSLNLEANKVQRANVDMNNFKAEVERRIIEKDEEIENQRLVAYAKMFARLSSWPCGYKAVVIFLWNNRHKVKLSMVIYKKDSHFKTNLT